MYVERSGAGPGATSRPGPVCGEIQTRASVPVKSNPAAAFAAVRCASAVSAGAANPATAVRAVTKAAHGTAWRNPNAGQMCASAGLFGGRIFGGDLLGGHERERAIGHDQDVRGTPHNEGSRGRHAGPPQALRIVGDESAGIIHFDAGIRGFL